MDAGQLLGNRYRLDQRVEGGGMGDVWRGHDTRLDRTVAIKVLHSGLSGDSTFRQRFQGEARAVAALQAPGVVNLFDYGEDDTIDSTVVSYLVMEFVPGKSLRTVLNERARLSNTDTLDIIAQAADALDAAHRAGIVHRDVKPGNILIDQGSGQIKLVDFGIARTRGQSPLTETGAVMGSVSYVSPEALYGRELTGASDVYSLGVVAYECLAGAKPFPGDVPATIIAEQLHKTPPPLPETVSAELSSIVMRALAKDPYDRWESAADFAAACRQLRETSPIDVSTVGDNDETITVAADAIPTTVLPKEPAAQTVRLSTRASDHKDHTPTSPQPTTEPPKPKRGSRMRARAFVVIATVLALLTAGGVAAAYTWHGPDDPGADDASSTQVIDDESSESSSSSESESTEETVSQEEPSSSESESSSSSESPSESSSSPEPETGTVPDLMGLSEEDAYGALSAEGFENASSYPVGSGSVPCTVVEQDPGGGTETELDTDVSFGVEYVPSEEECGGDDSPSEDTSGPETSNEAARSTSRR